MSSVKWYPSSGVLSGSIGESASQDSFVDESWGAELKLAENERWAGRNRGED